MCIDDLVGDTEIHPYIPTPAIVYLENANKSRELVVIASL
jgi:hypothetical protein